MLSLCCIASLLSLAPFLSFPSFSSFSSFLLSFSLLLPLSHSSSSLLHSSPASHPALSSFAIIPSQTCLLFLLFAFLFVLAVAFAMSLDQLGRQAGRIIARRVRGKSSLSFSFIQSPSILHSSCLAFISFRSQMTKEPNAKTPSSSQTMPFLLSLCRFSRVSRSSRCYDDHRLTTPSVLSCAPPPSHAPPRLSRGRQQQCARAAP